MKTSEILIKLAANNPKVLQVLTSQLGNPSKWGQVGKAQKKFSTESIKRIARRKKVPQGFQATPGALSK